MYVCVALSPSEQKKVLGSSRTEKNGWNEASEEEKRASLSRLQRHEATHNRKKYSLAYFVCVSVSFYIPSLCVVENGSICEIISFCVSLFPRHFFSLSHTLLRFVTSLLYSFPSLHSTLHTQYTVSKLFVCV
jgi:hypothetical protein